MAIKGANKAKVDSGPRRAPRSAQQKPSSQNGQKGLLWHAAFATLALAFAAAFLRLGRNVPRVLAARKLPDMRVFGEEVTRQGKTPCQTLHASREVPEDLQPPQRDHLSFCEDAELLEGDGLEGAILFSCDPNRGNWNTVMGPLRDPKPRGALWLWSRDGGDEAAAGNPSEPYPLHLLNYPRGRDFHPLGTAYDPHSRRLYAVNHARARSAIEVFVLEQGSSSAPWEARYLRSLEDSLGTHTPNAIAILSSTSKGGGEILVSQDHFFARRSPGSKQLKDTYTRILTGARSGTLRRLLTRHLFVPVLSRALDVAALSGLAAQIETLMAIPGGHVVQLAYQDWTPGAALDPSAGIETRIVLQGCPFANGLALDPHGKALALSCTTAPSVRLYDVDLGTADQSSPFTPLTSEDAHALKQRSSHGAAPPLRTYSETSLPFLPDNIAVVHTSTPARLQVVAAGHPDPLGLIKLAKDPYSRAADAPHFRKRESPSMVHLLEFERGAASENKEAEEAWKLKSRAPLYEARNGPVALPALDGAGAGAHGNEVPERIGISASAGAAFDPSTRTLVVAGLYGEGVMVCQAGK